MNIDINNNLYVAKRCFERWSGEQDRECVMYATRVEEYYSSYLYGDLVDLQNYPSAEIGEYIKAFMRQVDKELEFIHIEEQQRIRDKIY